MAGYRIPINERLEETTQHGSKDFPLALYQTRLISGSLTYVPIHWHKELQLCLVTRGTVCFTVNQDKIEVPTGGALFINSKVIHCAGVSNSAGASQNTDAEYICLDFGYELLGGFSGSRIERDFVLPFINRPEYAYLKLSPNCADHSLIMKRVLSIRDLYVRDDKEDSYGIFVCLAEIWRELCRQLKRVTPKAGLTRAEDAETARRVIAFIEKNFQEGLDLDKISSEVFLSKWECSRRFKRMTGKTIWAYLTSVRLAHSVRLLLHSPKTVERIAFECGFSNVNIFIRRFKEEFGMPPGKFKRKG